MTGGRPAFRFPPFAGPVSALCVGVDDVVPVGVSGRASSLERDVWRDLQPFAQVLRLAAPGLVAVLRQDDGSDAGEGAGGKADLLALASRGRAGGGEECLAGGTSLDLGQAEGVDGALGHDEGRQVSGGSGADGEQAAGSAGGEASGAVGRADLQAGEPAVPVAVGEEDAAAPDARRRQARTAEASPQQAHDGQKDDGSRTTGRRTILSRARPAAEIPPFYVSVNTTSEGSGRSEPDGPTGPDRGAGSAGM